MMKFAFIFLAFFTLTSHAESVTVRFEDTGLMKTLFGPPKTDANGYTIDNTTEFEKSFEKDFAALARTLLGPEDPAIHIRVTDNYSSYKSDFNIEKNGNVYLSVDSGVFASTKNLNEVAGVLSIQFSKIRSEYKKFLLHKMSEIHIPKDTNRTEYLLQDWHKKQQDQATSRLDLTKAYDLYELSKNLDAIEKREENVKLKQVIQDSGIKIDLSKNAQEQVKQSLDAVDRLVKGGFNPWGIYQPKKKLGELERLGWKQKGAIRKFFDKNQNSSSVNSEAATELAFLETYLLYLESKKVDITQQKYRNQGLTPEMKKLQTRAYFTQTVKFGPAMQDLTISGVVIGVAGVAIYKGAAIFSGAFSGVTKVGDWISSAWNYLFGKGEAKPVELIRNLPEAPRKMVEEGPGFFSWLWNGTKNIFGSMYDGTSHFLKEYVSTPAGNFYDHYLSGAIDPLKNASYEAYLKTKEFMEPLLEPLKEVGVEGAKVATATFAAYLVDRIILSKPNLWSNKYLSRYVTHLSSQVGMMVDLIPKYFLGATPKNIQESVKLQEAMTKFVEDGMKPNDTRIINRMIYQVLFDKGAFWYVYHSQGSDGLMQEHRQEVYQKIAKLLNEEQKTVEYGIKSKEVKKLARQLTYPEYFLDPKQPYPSEVVQNLDLYTYKENATKYQRFLYFTTGALSYQLSNFNTNLLLNIIHNKLQDPKISETDKAEYLKALENIAGLDLYTEATRRKYLAIFEKYFPNHIINDLRDPLKLNEYWENKKNSFNDKIFRTSAGIVSKNKGLPTEHKILHFKTLVDNHMNEAAAHYLRENLEEIVNYVHGKEGAVDSSRATLRGTITSRISSLFFQINNENLSFLWHKKLLLLKALSIKDKNVRLAFFTHNIDKIDNDSGPLDKSLRLITESIVSKYLGQVKTAHELIEVLERLGNEHHVETRFLAEYFLSKLKENPQMIKSIDDIKGIINSDKPWHILSSVAREHSSTNWENAIFQRYESLSRKYKSYNYNPGHSEKIQKILMDRFSAVHANATTEEKLELWSTLASRGPGGVTDTFFESILKDLDATKAEKACLYALENGLVWDPQIRTRLYKELYKDKISEKAMQEFSRNHVAENFTNKIAEYRNSKEKPPVMDFISKNFAKEIKTLENNKKLRQEIYIDISKALKNPHANLTDLADKYSSPLEKLYRQQYIDQNISKLHDFFPETGYAFASLLDWLSYQVRTTQDEAFYIKDKLVKDHSENKDLAYSAVSSIIEDATTWPKAEQWALIRWLRGTGPVPAAVAYKMKKMGPETMRRLYSTLPIYARRAFISTLLNAPKSGLLNGIGKNSYYEQVLNEVLPKKRQSSQTAQELLSAFLKAVGEVSDPAKKNSVLSFLLSHPAENSDTGTVLKNILEAYGVPGVKLGQLLASSDLLPEDMREKLSELRDQAKEPFRHEIYERLQDILKEKNIQAKFVLVDLLGAASVKYAVTVIDKNGKTHVIQIKREEAEAAISRNFEELKIIVEDLIHRDPKKYAFLKGMVEATKDAIWRELSLLREGKKAQLAKEEYKKLDVQDHVKMNVVQATKLIEELGGPKERFYYLRSSELADGKFLKHFPIETQKALAKVVLAHEKQLIFPADKRDTKVDPDRHPGNILFKIDSQTGEIEYQPIDWGQQYDLSEKERNQVKKFMAYSQLFEHLGAMPSLADKFIADIQADEGALDVKQLKKLLASFYPNKTGKPRSSLGPYYFLLSALEDSGMRRNMAYYDLIKGIYQLEYYESLLKGEVHESPKRDFAAEVEKEANKIAKDLNPSFKEKVKFALSDPKAALVAHKNAQLAFQGVLAIDELLSSMGLSEKSRKQILKNLNKADSEQMLNAEHIIDWLKIQSQQQEKNISKNDAQVLKNWLGHERLKNYNLVNMTKEEVHSLMNNPTVLEQVHGKNSENIKNLLKQPYKHEFFKGMGNVYAAELVNSIFWGIYDKDPIRAQEWFFSMQTLSKHTGFLAFAASHSGIAGLSNKLLPMSYTGSRYFMNSGVSVAAGMLASDIVHRLFSGESFADIWESIATKEYGKELAFQTGNFMVSEAIASLGLSILGNALPKSISCNYVYQKILPLVGAFVGSEAINRTAGEKLRDIGILDRNELQILKGIVDKHHDKITASVKAVDAEIKAGNFLRAREIFTGIKKLNSADQVGSTRRGGGYTFSTSRNYTDNDLQSTLSLIQAYSIDLDKVLITLKNRRAIKSVIEEKVSMNILKEQISKIFTDRVWTKEEIEKIDPENVMRRRVDEK